MLPKGWQLGQSMIQARDVRLLRSGVVVARRYGAVARTCSLVSVSLGRTARMRVGMQFLDEIDVAMKSW
jgi:hypothetical protein